VPRGTNLAYGATKKGAVTNAGYTRITRFGDQSSANAKKDEAAPVQINRRERGRKKLRVKEP
jgi:hypothetical protein